MTPEDIQSIVDEATFDFTMGDSETAIGKLTQLLAGQPEAFEAWHALSEINFSLRRYDDALPAAERALALQPDDLFVNTTLSRIWMEKGDKVTAEKYGAKAKILSWKDQLKNPEDHAGGI